MSTAPIVLIDTMLGFRIVDGMVVLNLGFARTQWDGAQLTTFLQPTVDIAMPIPCLHRIIEALGIHLAEATARADLPPHPTQQ